jgi:hypothetical protein
MSNASDSRFTRRCVVRFTVGEPKGSQSSVWRLWTHGNDVYISLRDLTKVKKVSLHPSGRWRNAWAEEHVAKGSPFVAPGQDRATDKWERPPELAPGVTRAFDIVVPASEVTQPQHLDPNSLNGKKIMWVPPAPEGYATYFTVVFTTAAVTATTLPGWPGRNDGTELVWRVNLPNEETVWLITYERPVDPWMQQHLAEFKRSAVPAARRRIEEAGYSSDIEDARAAIYYRNEDLGMRFYIDVSCVELQG